MSNAHGKFVWYELMTTDTAAAAAFYRSVIGWNVADAGLPDRDYMVLSAGATGMGGLMAVPAAAREAGARPGWTGYIEVDDVDATAARITAAGGAIHHAAAEIPGIGRFAVVSDPQGAAFTLFKPLPQDMPAPAPAAATPGRVGWHELHAADRESAFAFYAEMFGWTKDHAFDMGPMGIYQIFATGDAPLGGMMTKTDTIPRPVWVYYFNVEDMPTAIARVQAASGKILHGPQQVPGGSLIAQCLDPQGAFFAMVAPDR